MDNEHFLFQFLSEIVSEKVKHASESESRHPRGSRHFSPPRTQKASFAPTTDDCLPDVLSSSSIGPQYSEVRAHFRFKATLRAAVSCCSEKKNTRASAKITCRMETWRARDDSLVNLIVIFFNFIVIAFSLKSPFGECQLSLFCIV